MYEYSYIRILCRLIQSGSEGWMMELDVVGTFKETKRYVVFSAVMIIR